MDKICGHTIEEAIEILEKYNAKQLVPVDYIEEKIEDYYFKSAHSVKKISDHYADRAKYLSDLLSHWRLGL